VPEIRDVPAVRRSAMVIKSTGKVYPHPSLLIAVLVTAAVFVVFAGSDACAQVGLRGPASSTAVVKPYEGGRVPLGLGLGNGNNILYPARRNFAVRSVVLDTLSNKYVITERVVNTDVNIPFIMDMDRYIDLGRQNTVQRLWRESTLRTVNSELAQAGPQAMSITIPVPIRSETFSRIVGSNDISLAVTGEVDIKGNLVKNDYSQVKDINRGSDYSFKLEQTQRFHITGKVGEKISVLVDQDSERDFDIQNNIRLFYTGDEDEVFKSIEAGNVSLALPGTQFVTFSGVNKGLFGFKTVNQIGPLSMTSIASLERGQKQSKRITGGEQKTKQVIKDYNYLEGTYFFVDHGYRDDYEYDPGSGLLSYDPNNVIDLLEIWVARQGDHLKSDSEEAWAVSDPDVFVPDTNTVSDQNHIKRYFRRLEANVDYMLNKNLGYIIMNRPVRNGEILALGYTTESGKEVGQLFPKSYSSPADSLEPFILKLIRTDNPLPSDAGWDLEWRNVYYMGKDNVKKEGFEMQIVDNKTPERSPIQPTNQKTFLEIFGFDRADPSGAPVPDNVVDVENVYLFDWSRGHIIFPGKRPFDPPKDPFTGQSSGLDSQYRVPAIYDTMFVNLSERAGISSFDIEIGFTDQGSTVSLGVFNVIEGSEEVYLNGQPLARGVDYDIDYAIGQVTILNSTAMTQGQELEIKYESAEIFQLDKKTMFGTRLNYEIGENSFIGASALFLNESTVERFVLVGQEPIKNLVWGMNARFQKNSTMATNLIDKLPLIEAMAPSSIQFEGEFAQSRPNPNTMTNGATGDGGGVAFIDNFEGSKRVSFLGIMRREWTLGSRPIIVDPVLGTTMSPEKENRAKLIWYNPYQQVDINDIFPNKDTNYKTKNRVNVLNMGFIRDSKGEFPEDRPWGSVMKAMSPGYYNQTESKYLEMWIRGDSGTVYVDLGLISEDAIENNELNSEDLVVSSFPNGVLDPGEDIGLDMIDANDTDASSGELLDDDWNYNEASNDYRNINGTEGNGSEGKVDGARIPDTEDLNANGSLDTRNDYFQFAIHLGDDHPLSSRYIVGGMDNAKGWRQYRIPLTEFTGKVGNPDLSRVEYARVSLTEMREDQFISIYNIDLVGNKWIELGFADSDSLVRKGTYVKKDSQVVVGVVNTEENPDYVSPPGVEGFIDPITKAREREQSLQFSFTDLPSGNSAAIRQSFIRDQDLLHYRYLKIFVYNDVMDFGDSSNVEFYLQFGRDNTNYYEVRRRLGPDWNEIVIDLYEIPQLKTDLYSGFRILENGDEWFLQGNPSLSAVRHVVAGIKNRSLAPMSGRIWLDELRVSEVDRTPGQAFRASVNMQLSDLATVSVNYTKKEADFHTLNEKYGTGNNSDDIGMVAQFDVTRVLTPLKMFNIPVNLTYRKSEATPKWLQGSDILYSDELEEAESEKMLNKSTGISTSFSKRTTSNNFLIRNTLDALSGSFQHQKTSIRDINNEINDSYSNSGSVNYDFTAPSLQLTPLKFLGDNRFVRPLSSLTFNLLPDGFQTSLAATQTGTDQKLRVRNATIEAETKKLYRFEADRVFSTSYAPIPSLTMTLSRSSKHDLGDLKDPTKMFSQIFNDSTQISANQEFTANYKPTFLPWLDPSANYRAGYSLTKNRQLAASGKTAAVSRSVTTRIAFSPQRMINVFYKTEQAASAMPGRRTPVRRRPAAQRRAQQQEEEQQKPPEEEKKEDDKKGGLKLNPLYYLERMTSVIAPIAVTFDKTVASQAPGLSGTPTMDYQFGFSMNPGVEILPGIGQNTGSLTDTEGLGFSSRLSLSRYISVSLNYQVSNVETDNANTKTGSKSKTIFYMNDKELPLPQYTIQINDLHRFFIFSKLANSIKYNLSYDGKKTESWKDTPDNLARSQIDYGFRPLVGLNILWKKGITTTFQMAKSTSIQSVQGGSETKTTTNTMSLTTSFQWNTGFRIPLPFFGSKRIQNSVQFSMTFNKNANATYQRYRDSNDFELSNDNNNWSVRPQLSYSFSQRVTGSMFFEYRNNNNIRVGQDSSKDFGLQVLIRIAG